MSDKKMISERDLAELRYLLDKETVKAEDLNGSDKAVGLILCRDLNGDGVVDAKDLKALKKALISADAASAARMVADLNGDGVLSEEEIDAFHACLDRLKGAKE